MEIRPAEADAGIVFVRTADDGTERSVQASWRRVVRTELCTTLGDRLGPVVSTVEHVMAACAGLGLDNARVEVDGPELPIMDGSAAAFVEAIDSVGVLRLGRPRRYVRVRKKVRVEHGPAFAELSPSESGPRLDIEIAFENGPIRRQRVEFDVTAGYFRRYIARARTFGFVADVERLWTMGLARGSSLENSVAIDGERILNPEGLRYPDEFVRHKALDAIGDLALAGAPIVGAYRACRPGHALNVRVLNALFSDPDAYEIVEGKSRRAAAEALVASSLVAY